MNCACGGKALITFTGEPEIHMIPLGLQEAVPVTIKQIDNIAKVVKTTPNVTKIV